MKDHDTIQTLLPELLDDELERSARVELEGHLRECAECREEMEFLVSLRARARALPREMAPTRDLWAGIAERLEVAPATDARVIPIGRAAGARRPSRWRGIAAAAIAASVLVALSSTVTARLLQRQPEAVAPVAGVPAAMPAEEDRPLTALAAFEPAEREYLGTLEVLEAQLEARRGSLSPQTLAVVDENLRIIDTAIEEIRGALEADSANVELPLLLGGVYRTKVELLQSTVRLNART